VLSFNTYVFIITVIIVAIITFIIIVFLKKTNLVVL
jgi:hypothetical protein